MSHQDTEIHILELRAVPFKSVGGGGTEDLFMGGGGGGGEGLNFGGEGGCRILNFSRRHTRGGGGGGAEFLISFRSSPYPHF